LAIYYPHASCLRDALLVRALEMYTASHLFDTIPSVSSSNSSMATATTRTTSTASSSPTAVGNATIADMFDLLDPQFVLNVITLAWTSHPAVTGTDTHSTDAIPTKTTVDQRRQAFSLRLSLLVAVYCHLHYQAGDLDWDMFDQLTDASLLPTLEAPAAKAFLELVHAYTEPQGGGMASSLLSVPRADRIASLTERCVAVLAEHWDDECLWTEQEQGGGRSVHRTVHLPRLTGPALESLVSQSLVHAKDRLGRLEAEKVEVTSRNDTLQQQLDELQRQNELLQSQLREARQQPGMAATSVARGTHSPNENLNGALVCSNKCQRTGNAANDLYHLGPSDAHNDMSNAIPSPPSLKHSRSFSSIAEGQGVSADGTGKDKYGPSHSQRASRHEYRR
jgi:hypothetical protein